MRRERHRFVVTASQWLWAFAEILQAEILAERKFPFDASGFRFLFAAIVLCMSYWSLGWARCLLRTAHETLPAILLAHAAEPRFAQQEATNRSSPSSAPAVPDRAGRRAESSRGCAAVTNGLIHCRSSLARARNDRGIEPAGRPPAGRRQAPPPATEAPSRRSRRPSEPAPAQADAPASETKTAAAEETKTVPADNAAPSRASPRRHRRRNKSPRRNVRFRPGRDQDRHVGGPAVTIDPLAAAEGVACHARSQPDQQAAAGGACPAAAKDLQRNTPRSSIGWRFVAPGCAASRDGSATGGHPFAPHPLPGRHPRVNLTPQTCRLRPVRSRAGPVGRPHSDHEPS